MTINHISRSVSLSRVNSDYLDSLQEEGGRAFNVSRFVDRLVDAHRERDLAARGISYTSGSPLKIATRLELEMLWQKTDSFETEIRYCLEDGTGIPDGVISGFCAFARQENFSIDPGAALSFMESKMEILRMGMATPKIPGRA